jgi:hypothetical protein
MDVDSTASDTHGPEKYTVEAVFGGQSPLSSAPSSYHPSPQQAAFRLPAIGETSGTASEYSSVGVKILLRYGHH